MDSHYQFPEKARFGRNVPKTKIYENAKATSRIKQKFIQQVEKIVWQYKLAEETINLSTTKEVVEIQVFDLLLKEGVDEIDEVVLRTIDKAIQHPIYFRVLKPQQMKSAMSYKRAHEGDGQKWVVGEYFYSDWVSITAKEKAVPVVLNLSGLYEKLLRGLIVTSPRKGESLAQQVERLELLRALLIQAERLEKKVFSEKQFNRKVETNSELKKLQQQIAVLNGE